MKNSKIKKYVLVMLIGVILNYSLYGIAHVFHLPVWMDSVGTAYIAIALEPAAGLIVAFATNFFESLFIYDVSSIVYYFTGATAALCFGVILRREGRISWNKLLKAILFYVAASTLIAGSLTLWRTAGVPDSGWERRFYQMAVDAGAPQALSCYFGTFVLKVFDSAVMAVLLPLFYKLTPSWLKVEKLEENVSWKNPFWKKHID